MWICSHVNWLNSTRTWGISFASNSSPHSRKTAPGKTVYVKSFVGWIYLGIQRPQIPYSNQFLPYIYIHLWRLQYTKSYHNIYIYIYIANHTVLEKLIQSLEKKWPTEFATKRSFETTQKKKQPHPLIRSNHAPERLHDAHNGWCKNCQIDVPPVVVAQVEQVVKVAVAQVVKVKWQHTSPPVGCEDVHSSLHRMCFQRSVGILVFWKKSCKVTMKIQDQV